MIPYYDRDGITIYNADCVDILPLIDPASVDLLLTDPPYGIGYVSSDYWDNRTIVNDDAPFNPRHLLSFKHLVLFGANKYAHSLPEDGGWIIWDKRDNTSRNLPGSDAEMAWTNSTKQIRLYRQVWMPHTIRGEPAMHPTQKPVALMAWILDNWTKPGDLVLDPYMGSGPIAEACHKLRRRYIGVEIVEEYCEIAMKRLAQQVFPFD